MTRTVDPRIQTASAAAANVTHGMSDTRVFRIWVGMLARCNNPKRLNFKNYGGRGIRVCDRWTAFENFYADMGAPPDGFELDREDNDGDYEPDNCRWLSVKANSRNRRTNRNLTLGCTTKCITDWAADLGITHQAINRRIDVLGWPIERALTEGKRA